MKPKIFTAILLFISAYSPLFAILGIKDFDFEDTQKFANPVIAGILFGFCLLSNAILYLSIKGVERGNMPVTITSVKSRSQDIINYTIPYIFCAFDIDFSKTADIITITFFLIILLILAIASQSVFLNPMLALMGYNFYDIEYTFDNKPAGTIAISNYDLKIGRRYYIRSLTRFIYFISDEIKQNNHDPAKQTASTKASKY